MKNCGGVVGKRPGRLGAAKMSGSHRVSATGSQSHSTTETRGPGSSRCSSDESTANEEGKVRRCPSPSSVDSKSKKQNSKISEIDMMKERFSKLLLGEDMSGSGKGVCTAMAISNAITNLCGTVFGQLWRLEPLKPEKKSMWQREMEWLLCVCDHIIEFLPSWQTFPDGKNLEVMTCRMRSDLCINIPALRKLDNILMEILDNFNSTEFWYVDQGVVVASPAAKTAPSRKPIRRQEDKWWLPVPRVPAGGIHVNSRKKLQQKRECANQILKAALAINSAAVADMEVPESYLEALPKNARACLGDVIYRHITSDHFSSESLLDCLDLSSEHAALEILNRVEASLHLWRQRTYSKAIGNPNWSATKSPWEMVKDLMLDGDKREFLAERAESLVLDLRQRFPDLAQTTLDISKIQCNQDVGKSILESYSRALESLASNIIARIDDLLYVDDLAKLRSGNSSPVAGKISVILQKKAPRKSTFPTPTSPATPAASPARGERTPLLSSSNKLNRQGSGVKRALTNYLNGETKTKGCGSCENTPSPNGADHSVSKSGKMQPASKSAKGGLKHQKESSARKSCGNGSRQNVR